jgi:hypothetical protein
MQRRQWQDVFKLPRWQQLPRYYRMFLLQQYLPFRTTMKVDWNQWTMPILRYALSREESLSPDYQLPTTPFDHYADFNRYEPVRPEIQEPPFQSPPVDWATYFPRFNPPNVLVNEWTCCPRPLTKWNLLDHRKQTGFAVQTMWNIQNRRWDLVFASNRWSALSENTRRFILFKSIPAYMMSTLRSYFILLGPVRNIEVKLEETFPPIPGVHIPGKPPFKLRKSLKGLSTIGPHGMPPSLPYHVPAVPYPLIEPLTPGPAVPGPEYFPELYTSWSENIRYRFRKLWQAIQRTLGLSKSTKRQDQLLTIASGNDRPRRNQPASAFQMWSVGGVFKRNQIGSNIQPTVVGFTRLPSEGVPWQRVGQLHAQEDIASQPLGITARLANC